MSQNKTQKYFYLPGHHRIVYVHDVDGKRLILGSCCNFITDSKTSILRQSITESAFKKLRPIELNVENPEQYSFLEKADWGSWMVKKPHHDMGGSYIKTAMKLPSVENYYKNDFML